MPDARVVEEFEQQLAELRVRYEGRPQDELTHLWLLALEREQLVTVAYRKDIIDSRLSRMPIDDEVRRIVARAIRWAWRDEQMHALWIRGALLRHGDRLDRLQAWRTQLEGTVAGWTSSRQAHFGWTEAPLRRVVAEILEVAGVATGRVPPAVREHLQFQTFAAFCSFNVTAETTAAMGWRRMVELAREPEVEVDDEDVQAYRRMAADEDRHARVFQLFARAFDDGDRLLLPKDELTTALGAIGQRFLASPSPSDPAWANPLGKGGTVIVREGTDRRHPPIDEVLDPTGLAARIAALRRKQGTVTVALKTTFMLAARADDVSPSVHVPLLRRVVRWLTERGATVDIIEAGNVYDRFHHGRSVHEVARFVGLEDVRVVDAQADQVAQEPLRGLGVHAVCRAWQQADLRIVVGKLRSHPTTTAMLCMDASEGLGPRHDHFIFSDRKADRETVILALLDAYPPDLGILDAFADVPDGLLGMMGSRRPLQPLRIYASTDLVALDAVVARHIQADLPAGDMLLCHAIDWFGDPTHRTVVDGPDTPIPGWRPPAYSQRTALLSRLALPVWDHASKRGALFVPPMDPLAFPQREEPTPALKAARAAVWALIGSDHPITTPTGTVFEVVHGRRLRLRITGSGPPLLMLHGYPDTLEVFRPITPLLAENHTVIAFDWPGQGFSEAWPGSAGPGALAAQLERVLDHLGIEEADLYAQDMGGPPALVLAATKPDRVRRVVVANSLLFHDAPTSWEITVMRRTGLNALAFRYGTGMVWRQSVRTFLPDDYSLPEDLAADMHGALRQRAVRNHLSAMCRDYEDELPRLAATYRKVTCPVLALWAEGDAHFPPVHGERLAEGHPRRRCEVVQGAAHWMVLHTPESVAGRLLAFLD